MSIIDLPTGRVVRTVATGDEPTDVVFAGAPQRAFVSVSQLNQVRVFDPANLALAPTILTIQGEEPRTLAVSADGARASMSESSSPAMAPARCSSRLCPIPTAPMAARTRRRISETVSAPLAIP